MASAKAQLSARLKSVTANRAIRLNNVTCVYCGIALEPESSTLEHVVGRRFVPKGKLNAQWNLLLNACEGCNSKKSDLEDDISAITMQPDVTGTHPHGDADAAAEAERKGKGAISRRTKKLVRDSRENVTITAPFGNGATFTFNFVSPPQLDEDRAFQLARMQLTAFFYWITYNADARRGYYWTGGFHPVMCLSHADWGNPIMVAFADAVAEWEPRVFGGCADGFYKVVIRRHPSAECWSWAVEWNHATRLIGFFGQLDPAREIAASFPELQVETVQIGASESVSYREQTSLTGIDDKMFSLNDELYDSATQPEPQ